LWQYTELFCKFPLSQDEACLAKKQSRCGRKAGVCSQFASDAHPQYKTHLVRLQGLKSEFVPVLLGKVLPRPDRDKDERELWCRTMLILFKPWRQLSDLNPDNIVWSKAYRSCTFSPCCLRIIKNMNVENECKDSRDTYKKARRSGRTCKSLLGVLPETGVADIESLETLLLNDASLDDCDSSHEGSDIDDDDTDLRAHLEVHKASGLEAL
jgi:hypothetical protein